MTWYAPAVPAVAVIGAADAIAGVPVWAQTVMALGVFVGANRWFQSRDDKRRSAAEADTAQIATSHARGEVTEQIQAAYGQFVHDVHDQVKDMEARLKKMEAAVQHERSGRVDAETNAANLLAQLTIVNQKLAAAGSELQEQIANGAAERRQMQTEVAELRREITELKSQIVVLKAERAARLASSPPRRRSTDDSEPE